MSRMPYYYDPPKSLNMIREPGECCDYCSLLSRLTPAGQMILMPCDGLAEEYGGEEGDIHMHLKCAEAARDEYKRLYEESDAAIKKFLAEKQGK